MAAWAAALSLSSGGAMQDIVNALPDAAIQVSNMITAMFESGVAWIIAPFVFIELAVLVFRSVRGKSD